MPQFEEQQEQIPSFTDVNPYFDLYEKRYGKRDEENVPFLHNNQDDTGSPFKIESLDKMDYLTVEHIVKLLVTEVPDNLDQNPDQKTETSDKLDQEPNQSNVLIDSYSIGDNSSYLSLEIRHQKDIICAETIQPSPGGGEHALVFLLASFLILRRALEAPQEIKYEQDEKETTIKENESGVLEITISPYQTNPLIFLLFHIYTQYRQHKNNVKEMQKSIFYYEKLNKFVKGLKTEEDLSDPVVIIERIKNILNFFSNLVIEFSKKDIPRPEPLSLFSKIARQVTKILGCIKRSSDFDNPQSKSAPAAIQKTSGGENKKNENGIDRSEDTTPSSENVLADQTTPEDRHSSSSCLSSSSIDTSPSNFEKTQRFWQVKTQAAKSSSTAGNHTTTFNPR